MANKRVAKCVSTLLITLGLLIPAIGCGGAFTGSSNIETREMDFSDFTKLEVSHAFEVDISRGDSYFVSITANDNLFEHFDIRQSGKTLYIGLKQPRIYVRTTQKVAIVMPELARLNLSGASKGEVNGFTSDNPIEFDLSGASSLKMEDIQAGDTEFDVSGASKVTGSIEISDCSFNISGASTVELTGTAVDISIEASGASKVRLLDLPVRNADIELSGASKGTINASGRLDVDLSGGSELNYINNPTIGTIDISGGSRLNRK